MKLETKQSLYFVLVIILVLVGLSIMMINTGLPWQQGVPIKIGGLIMFWIGTVIFNKHFKINE